MIPDYFKKQASSLKKKFKERSKLLKPFIKLYKSPVLVHAVYDVDIFYKILKDGKIKKPSNHSSPKKTPYMEKILNTDRGIYYSLGFQYLTSYEWNYNLIFDLNYMKDLIYYKKGTHYKAYIMIVDYWFENDKAYLEKLANKNRLTREVINTYYTKKYNGKVRKILEFWKIEKELYNFFENYPRKKELINLIRKMAKERFLKYPASKKNAKQNYMKEYAPEMIGKKENNLLKNPSFLGFGIIGKIPKKVEKILKEKYADKIIFDGKKIKKIINDYPKF
jgi:hypothetical protein